MEGKKQKTHIVSARIDNGLYQAVFIYVNRVGITINDYINYLLIKDLKK